MNQKIRVEGQPNLCRDKYSRALLNTNVNEVITAKNRRKERERLSGLEETVGSLKQNITELKDLLNNLIREIKK